MTKEDKVIKVRDPWANALAVIALTISLISLLSGWVKQKNSDKELLKTNMRAFEKLGTDIGVALFISIHKSNSIEKNDSALLFRINDPQTIMDQLGLKVNLEQLFNAHINSPKNMSLDELYKRISRSIDIKYSQIVAEVFSLSFLITWNTLEIRRYNQTGKNLDIFRNDLDKNLSNINNLISKLDMNLKKIEFDDISRYEQSLLSTKENLMRILSN